MDITGMDITILVASTTGIILMSFAFPALGLTGDEATTDEVPNFDIETNRFDMVGDFPDRPSAPSGGTLVFTGDLDPGDPGSGETDNDLWLKGGSGGGQFLYILGEGNNSDPEAFVEMQDWDGGSVTEVSNATLTVEGERATLETTQDTDWAAYIELDRVYNPSENVTTLQVVYEIEHDENDDGSWWSGVPILGDTAEGVQWVARTVVYIGNVILWGILTFVEFIWNMSFALIEVVTFFFGLASFLVNTYSDVTTAPGLASWAQVILLIPGILFMVSWGKVALVLINTIWIG